MQKKLEITEQTRLLEVAALALTGIGKFVFMDWLDLKFLYISVTIVFWIGYIFFRYKENKAILQYWGLNTLHFKKTFFQLFPVALLIVIGFIVVGEYIETNILSWHIIPILILYPLWGVIQQFIMIGIFASNLRDMQSVQLPQYVIVILIALIFAGIHYPFLFLIIGTFFLALAYTTLFFKNRNLIVMGIYHGWLGAFFYYTIMGQDVLMDVFGKLLPY